MSIGYSFGECMGHQLDSNQGFNVLKIRGKEAQLFDSFAAYMLFKWRYRLFFCVGHLVELAFSLSTLADYHESAGFSSF